MFYCIVITNINSLQVHYIFNVVPHAVFIFNMIIKSLQSKFSRDGSCTYAYTQVYLCSSFKFKTGNVTYETTSLFVLFNVILVEVHIRMIMP